MAYVDPRNDNWYNPDFKAVGPSKATPIGLDNPSEIVPPEVKPPTPLLPVSPLPTTVERQNWEMPEQWKSAPASKTGLTGLDGVVEEDDVAPRMRGERIPNFACAHCGNYQLYDHTHFVRCRNCGRSLTEADTRTLRQKMAARKLESTFVIPDSK